MEAVGRTTQQLSASESATALSLAAWMRANQLQLNTEKTETMWCVPPRRHYQVPAKQLIIDNTLLPCVDKVPGRLSRQ